jgi:hypothetical protein
MNHQDLIQLGVPPGEAHKLAYEHIKRLFATGAERAQVEEELSK